MTLAMDRRMFLAMMAASTRAAAAGAAVYDIDTARVLSGPKPRLTAGAARAVLGDTPFEMLRIPRGDAAAMNGIVVRRRPGASTFLFCPGNGYSAATALQRLASAPVLASWSIAVFDYWSVGDAAPTIRATKAALGDAVRLLRRDARRIVVAGHSLGCWFAADLAASAVGVDHALLIAPGTTIEAVVRNTIDVTPGRKLRIDPDLASFDMVRQASRIRVPTAVLASQRDTVMPAAFAERIYRALPGKYRASLMILPDVDHGAFFTDPRTWVLIAFLLDKDMP